MASFIPNPQLSPSTQTCCTVYSYFNWSLSRDDGSFKKYLSQPLQGSGAVLPNS